MTRKYTDARKDSNRKWDAANLDRISIALPKGMKDVIKAYAEGHGESVNAFVARAIDETISREGDLNIIKSECRCRNVLKREGITLHKERNKLGEAVFYLTDGDDMGRPDDNDNSRWLSFDGLISFCAELEEDQAERRAAERA